MKRILGAVLAASLAACSVYGQASSPPTIWQTRSPIVVQGGHFTVDGIRTPLVGATFDIWARLYTCLTYNRTLGYNQINPAGTVMIRKQIKSMRDAGMNCIRFLGDDTGLGNNAFCTSNGPQNLPFLTSDGTTHRGTRQIDPAYFQFMDVVMQACDDYGMRIIWVANMGRQFMPPAAAVDATATTPAIPASNGDTPPWACPTFTEMTTHSYLGAPVGCGYPWRMYDAGVRQLDYEFWGQFLNRINALTGVRYGDQIDMIIVQNEHSLCKLAAWSYPAHPVMQSLYYAAAVAWCQAHGIDITTNKWGNPQHIQFAIDTEAAVGQQDIAAMKALAPKSLVCLTDYFGNGPYSMHAAGAKVADFLSVHFYSYAAASELIANGGPGSGLYNGLKPGDLRCRMSSVLAGAAQPRPDGTVMPAILDEVAPVAQFNQLLNGKMQIVKDPDAERIGAFAAILQVAKIQGSECVVVYSWGHSPWIVNGAVQTVDNDPYDFSNDAVFQTPQFKQLIANFKDISQPAPPTVTVNLNGGITNGLSPYTTWPGLYGQPQSNRLILAP